MVRSPLLRLLLVFALLLTQAGGFAHGIAHTLADHSQEQSLPHDGACELCAVYAQIGSALGSSALPFDFSAPHETSFAPPAPSFRSATFAAFAARAPPRSA